MKAEDVPQEWVERAAATIYDRHAARMGYVDLRFADVAKSGASDTLNRWRDDARAALAAVIPLVQAAEREACAEALESVEPQEGCAHLTMGDVLAAIRARNPA